jgi:arginase
MIVSPYFLDRPVPGLRSIAGKDDMLLETEFGAGDQKESVAPLHRMLAGHVAGIAARGGRPRAIFGDCCQVIPILAGLQRAGIAPTMIWLDSHGDFNTPETTPSSFLGGMPLAMITGRGDLRMPRNVGLQTLPDQKVVLSDGRDLDPGEQELVEESSIRHVHRVVDLMQDPLPEGPLYVHFDTDIIDAAEAPAFHYPVKGGPSADTMRDVLAHIARKGNVVATSMTAWAPELDTDGTTARKCLAAFEALNG